MKKHIYPSVISGAVTVPASKSHSIRALIIAAHAAAPSTIHNLLHSDDITSCNQALQQYAQRQQSHETHIDVGNSGTTLYFLSAFAALQSHSTVFNGDASIRSRNAAPLLHALTQMGASAQCGDSRRNTWGYPPYQITGPMQTGKTITIHSPTSQFLSALLLAVPLINNLINNNPASHTNIQVCTLNEHPYVDMTCQWLDWQGITYTREGYDFFRIPAGQQYLPVNQHIPGDYSAAAFWLCAAALTNGSVTVHGLRQQDTQADSRVLTILQDMGCIVQWKQNSVSVGGALQCGGTIDLNAMPDSLPALAALACYAPKPVRFTNAAHVRNKETDRIAVMVQELGKLNARIQEHSDGLTIYPSVLSGGTVSSHNDHRVAMALSIAALGAQGTVTICGAEAVHVTYPAFFRHLSQLSAQHAVDGV